MDRLKSILTCLACFIGMPAAAARAEPAESASPLAEITLPPPELQLDPFYRKCILLDGFPVVASDKVHDAALREAAWLIARMLELRPDILTALKASSQVRARHSRNGAESTRAAGAANRAGGGAGPVAATMCARAWLCYPAGTMRDC
jgi:hypothetical protein